MNSGLLQRIFRFIIPTCAVCMHSATQTPHNAIKNIKTNFMQQ